MTWRWWVFDRREGSHLDIGVIIGADRGSVERAASEAIGRLEQKREWPPERLATTTPGTTRP
jgi:hypothetical protein